MPKNANMSLVHPTLMIGIHGTVVVCFVSPDFLDPKHERIL